MSVVIKTIGHSNHPIERFVDLLHAGGVELLVDVRSTPWSRRFPQFGKERLAKALAEAGIGYLHEGAALGGKPEGGDSYDGLAARPAFREALDRLAERGVAVEHLLADGGIRPHAEIEDALLGRASAPDLFDDRATRLARAWGERERAMRRT